ncbi:MAG: preprotein translocase subunit SecG [Spirochaetaceae bacterium]|jgi:preprotein translocase subunit SecG|nr:preprotein translocase subunit SecG [Spirochaetaceae bacterium]
MAVFSVILLVFFVIIAILLILIVLVQNEEGNSIGGIFAGGSGSAFGSRSGNILTRATSVLGVLFFVIALGLALLHRSPGGSGVEASARQQMTPESSTDWFLDEVPENGLPSESGLPEAGLPGDAEAGLPAEAAE